MAYGDSYIESQDKIRHTDKDTVHHLTCSAHGEKRLREFYYLAPIYLLGSRLPSADVLLIKQREKLNINTGQDVRFALHLHIWSRHRHGYLTGLPGCTTATVRQLAMRKPLF